MAKAVGKIELGYATVHWQSRPTDYDSIGCQGLYVERVDIHFRNIVHVFLFVRDMIRRRLK